MLAVSLPTVSVEVDVALSELAPSAFAVSALASLALSGSCVGVPLLADASDIVGALTFTLLLASAVWVWSRNGASAAGFRLSL